MLVLLDDDAALNETWAQGETRGGRALWPGGEGGRARTDPGAPSSFLQKNRAGPSTPQGHHASPRGDCPT